MKKLIAILALVLTLAACGTTAPAIPLQLDGIYGGVLTYQGTNFALFGMEVNTTEEGNVSGYGVISDGYVNVTVSVSGSTDTGGGFILFLTDAYGDYFRFEGQRNDWQYTGHWSTNLGPEVGLVRFAAEEDVDMLSTSALEGYRLAELTLE